MNNSSNCHINTSLENIHSFIQTYNYTFRFIQPVVVSMTWATTTLCLSAVIINTAFVIALPRLLSTGQLAFKRYVFVLNLSLSDIVGCSVVGVFATVRLAAGESLFGDLVHAKFNGLNTAISAFIVTSYAPSSFTLTFVCCSIWLPVVRFITVYTYEEIE